MKILKCDICGFTQDPEQNYRDDFYEMCHDNIKYDFCKSCMDKYRQLKHDLTAAFIIYYPNREIEIKISQTERGPEHENS